MLKSMTAYGRASIEKPIGRFIAEIQSVNRKFLEINLAIPPELVRFDADIKKLIGEAVARGQISVKVFIISDRTTPVVVKPNLPLARQLKAAWDAIAKELEVEEDFELELLANEKGILLYNEEFKDEEEYRSAIFEALQLALEPFLKMKIREGAELKNDIEKRLANLQKSLNEIESKACNATSKYRQKLVDRLNEVLPGSIENEEKILREVCLFAEKIDITEEITRFKSHLKQCDQLIHSDTHTIGKTLEFMLQELNRETNTIGSKSADVDISRAVIEIKSELEKIREQIQNIE